MLLQRSKSLASCLVALCLLGQALGCEDSEQCSNSSDCFRGESCSDGACITENNGVNNGFNNGANNGSNNGPNNGVTNNGVTNNGVTNNGVTNNGVTNNGVTNNGVTNNGVNNGVLPLCVVDPFDATCSEAPDENDRFADYVSFPGGAPGCDTGDGFLAEEVMLEGVICASELRDKYNINLVPCDNITFIFETELHPREMCDPALWDFEVTSNGRGCGDPDVQCEDLPDGGRRVSIVIHPSNSLSGAYFDVTKHDANNVAFEYDLIVRVR